MDDLRACDGSGRVRAGRDLRHFRRRAARAVVHHDLSSSRSSLVLYGSYAKAINSDDYPSGVDTRVFETAWSDGRRLGRCALVDVFAPSVRDDAISGVVGPLRAAVGEPGAAVAIQRLNAELDVVR